MSVNSSQKNFNSLNEIEEKKPDFANFNHVTRLKIPSKRYSNIENFRKSNIFNPSGSNLLNTNKVEANFFVDCVNNSHNLFDLSNNKSNLMSSEDKNASKINEDKKAPKSNSSVDKKILKGNKNNKNKNKQPKKKKRGKKRNSRNDSSMYQPSLKLSKSSEVSNSSANSTKRAKIQLKAHNSPEKYPDDYLTIDSSTDEEDNSIDNNYGININNNSNNKLNKINFLNKKIMEKQNSYENDKIRKEIEQKINEFDLMSIDIKQLFRNNNFKKKYFKNIKEYIKIVYFDPKQLPLHAIFVFCDKDGNDFSKEKKVFSGAYSKNEFIQNFEKVRNEKKILKVELLADFADMNKNDYSNFIEPNKDLFIDFYFLINIFN